MAIKRRLPSLPEDIIFNILTRLPAKSLGQCKTVCRDWLAMISSHQFVREHLDRAKGMQSYDLHKFMYIRRRFVSQSITSRSINFSTFNQVPLRLPFSQEYYVNAEVVASCDGLVLLYKGNRTYVLWNPSTGVFMEFSGLHEYRNIPRQSRLYGIVYDRSTVTYKVIAIARINNSQEDTIITVYNCRTHSFTYSTGFQYWVPRNEQAVMVNEVPHWLVSHRENEGCAIIYYDLREERFMEVPTPDWVEDVSKLELMAHKGLLCLVQYRMGYADVWVMENYGERDSWTKLYPQVFSAGCFKWRPLGLTHDNQVVMEVNQCMVDVYDPTTHTFFEKNIVTYLNSGFEAATYVESIVSPNGGNEEV